MKEIIVDWSLYAPSQYQRRVYAIFWHPLLHRHSTIKKNKVHKLKKKIKKKSIIELYQEEI